MVDGRAKRRLAAILAADVVGYARLVGIDEEGTRRRFNTHVDELIAPQVAEHSGRIVKTVGDGLLIEFTSVVDAVACAVTIQEDMAKHQTNVPEEQEIKFRIGINLGDVLVEGDDIHGNGVNVAARLESLAEPGGICISGSVFDQIGSQKGWAFENLGEKTVKNIAEPVTAYKVMMMFEGPLEPTVDVSKPVKGFSGRPAIAVLPFSNLSGDPEQEFFVDGLTEDLILRLSYWRWFPIISRNSTFTFKGLSSDIKDVGEKLGARYVVEGSVRKAGDRIRVAAQLIDATNRHHVWADRFDRRLEDIFELQDEIADRIVAALEPAIGDAEQQRASVGNPDNLDAWEACQRGLWYFNRANKQDHDLARQWFLRSIELDPEFALPWGALSMHCFTAIMNRFTDDTEATIKEMRDAGLRSTAISFEAARGHLGIGWSEVFANCHDAGIHEIEYAIEYNPSFAPAYFYLGLAHMFSGDSAEALENISKAMRLSPRDPLSARMWAGASLAHSIAGEFEEGVEPATKSVRTAPDLPVAQRDLAIALAGAGKTNEARAAFKAFLKLAPGYTADQMRKSLPFKNPDLLEPIIDLLCKMGMSE